MTTVEAAREYRQNIGESFDLADAYDEAYLGDEVEDVDLMNREQRQALNASMFEYFFG